MTFLDKSTEPRDTEQDGTRFWWLSPIYTPATFGSGMVGIVDENEGGVVAYCHADNAERLVRALRAFTGED
jgi:hypothetical protein